MGCCGSKREQAARTRTPPCRSERAGKCLRARAEPGSADSQAGTLAVLAEALASPGPGPAGVPFVYDGLATLIVTGSATGRRYRFAGRGDRVALDPRDAPGLMTMEKLRCLAPG